MTDLLETSPDSDRSNNKQVTPLRCLVGSTISGSLGFMLYLLTASIAHSFTTKPLTSSNPLVLRIGSLVRTLVMGLASLGTFVFAFVALGLILLALQLLWQKQRDRFSSHRKESSSSLDNP